MKAPTALAINPYIYDFAAYNFWSSPLGLLYIAGILRANGFHVDLIDCMSVREDKRKPDGRAPFVKAKVATPDKLRGVGKPLRRYGMSPAQLRAALEGIEPPDIVLITSIMTYWYAGAEEVARIVREVHPRSKIVLGGIYPTLCPEEAQRNFPMADLIVSSGNPGLFYDYVEDAIGVQLSLKPRTDDLDRLPYPTYDLYQDIPFIPLLTSLGCAFKCTYCATSYMYPRMSRRSPESVIAEIRHWHDRGVTAFVFYDDSLLYRAADFARPLFEGIIALPFSIDVYNPNAVNAAFLTDEMAGLMVRAGFREVRLGLESVDDAIQVATGGKTTNAAFAKAVRSLKQAGYGAEDISAYILAGLPRQPWQDVKETIDHVRSVGATPYLAEYTPIPHTEMFERHRHEARFPIADDAVFQNNALFPYAWEGFTEENLNYLKRYVKGIGDGL